MSDFIRYAFGKTSLGDVMVAASDRGVVALEFVDDRNVTEELLRSRFMDAKVVFDQTGLSLLLSCVEFASRNRGRRDDELRSARCEIGHARRARRDCSDQY